MDLIVDINNDSRNYIELILLTLAVFRVYLEVIGFDFAKLPLTNRLSRSGGRSPEQLIKFHRMGLYFAIGFIVFTAPTYLFL